MKARPKEISFLFGPLSLYSKCAEPQRPTCHFMHPDFDPVPDCNSSLRARNWQFGAAPEAGRCAFFLTAGRLQHFILHLGRYAAAHGSQAKRRVVNKAMHKTADFVFVDGGMCSILSGDLMARIASPRWATDSHLPGSSLEVQHALIEANLPGCIVALPRQFFRGSLIPACLWFFANGKSGCECRDLSSWKNELAFAA